MADLPDWPTRRPVQVDDYLPGAANTSAAIQAAVTAATAAGTQRGTVELTPGKSYTLDAASIKIARSLPGLRFNGRGAQITLSAAAPRCFDFDKVADHDTFQNVEITDLTIDAANQPGVDHVVIGTKINGSTLQRVNLRNITLRRIKTVNVPVDSTTTIHRRNVHLVVFQPAAGEATQNTIEDVLIEDLDLRGGNAGIEVMGAGPAATGLNVYINRVVIQRCKHSLLAVQPAFPSANFQVGSRAFGGEVVLRDCFGEYSGDVGIELDSMTDMRVDGCHMKDSAGNAFYFTNFNYPGVDGGGPPTALNTTLSRQRIIWDQCRVTRLNIDPGAASRGFATAYNLNVPLGQVIVRDCVYYRNGGGIGATGEAVAFHAPCAAARVHGLRSIIENLFVGPAGGGTHYAILIDNGAQGVVQLRDVVIRLQGTRDGAGGLPSIYNIFVGGTAHSAQLDIDGVTYDVDMPTFTIRGLGLGISATTLRGSVRRLRYLASAGSNSSSQGILIGALANLTIASALLIEDCDFSASTLSAGKEIAFLTGDENKDLVVTRNIKPKTPLPARAAVTTFVSGDLAGTSPAVIRNLTTARQKYVVKGGTVNPVEVSRDNATYDPVAVATGVAVDLEPGDYLRVTYTVAPTVFRYQDR